MESSVLYSGSNIGVAMTHQCTHEIGQFWFQRVLNALCKGLLDAP